MKRSHKNSSNLEVTSPIITGERLANALHALGVKFIMGGESSGETLHQEPINLIFGLAVSNEARLRLALIPLFLEHPEFARHVRVAAQKLNASARITLQCYYCAAVWLQQEYRSRLNALFGQKQSLPDYFSNELGIIFTPDAEENLRLLAERHQILSGMRLNWFGTYQHAAQRWLHHAEREKHKTLTSQFLARCMHKL